MSESAQRASSTVPSHEVETGARALYADLEKEAGRKFDPWDGLEGIRQARYLGWARVVLEARVGLIEEMERQAA